MRSVRNAGFEPSGAAVTKPGTTSSLLIIRMLVKKKSVQTVLCGSSLSFEIVLTRLTAHDLSGENDVMTLLTLNYDLTRNKIGKIDGLYSMEK